MENAIREYGLHQTVYTDKCVLTGEDPLTVTRIISDPIDWLSAQHTLQVDRDLQNDTFDVTDAELKRIKTSDVPIFLASAFGKLQEPTVPQQSERKIRANGGVLRDFIAIDYDLINADDATELKRRVQEILINKFNVKLILYPSVRYPVEPRFRLVVDFEHLLNRKSYADVAERLIATIGIDTNDLVANKTIAHNFNAPYYLSNASYDEALINTDGTDLTLAMIGMTEADYEELIKPKRVRTRDLSAQKAANVTYRNNQIEPAIQAFINDPKNRAKLQTYDFFWRFAESLADAKMRNLVSDEFIDNTLIAVALGNTRWEEDNKTVYTAQLEKLENNPEKRRLVKSLASYLPIVSQVQQHNHDIQNLSQLLTALLPQDFAGDPEFEVKDAADIISQFFDFALLPDIRDDADALAIFNPLAGIWTHSDNDFIAMLSVVKPAITKVQITTALTYWAAQANHNERRIHPYNGSQYILFQNGVLDISNMELYPLTSEIVKNCQFTQRHQLKINYNPNAKLKVWEHDNAFDNSWSIDSMLDAYSGNDPDTRLYLLFGLSLGLFAGHNTGVHFDIQGESGSGKTTLVSIYQNLFGYEHVLVGKFSELNKDFPLNSYNPDVTVIWITECNENIDPLDEDHGTPFYDSLADRNASIPVKHKVDLVIKDPPQVYVDGTSLLQSTDIYTGPARRTLAFKLPQPIEPLRPQYYSNNIYDHLADEEVLQYLVNEALDAFRTIVPKDRWSNFNLNLGNKSDVDLLPEQARIWRQEFVNADANVREWYDEEIQPSLMINQGDAYVCDELFHKLYLAWYIRRNPQDIKGAYARRLPNFRKILHQIFQEDDLYCLGYADSELRNRRIIRSADSWGFDWSVYNEFYDTPADIKGSKNDSNRQDLESFSTRYGKRFKDLYRLVDQTPPATFYTQKGNGFFVPRRPSNELDNPKTSPFNQPS